MIITYTGKEFEPTIPSGEVDIVDIAHALGNICRFNGHCSRFYSVAEHSVRCAEAAKGYPDEIIKQCLMHDASEAYLGDIVTPLKRPMDWFYEDSLLAYICKAFGIKYPFDPVVWEIDKFMYYTEVNALMKYTCEDEWGPFGSPDLSIPMSGQRFLEYWEKLIHVC